MCKDLEGSANGPIQAILWNLPRGTSENKELFGFPLEMQNIIDFLL
jgi:hypothetical protein